MIPYQEVLNAEIEITKFLLQTVSSDGSWATADFSDWGPVITVLAVEHLLRCGVTLEDEWVLESDSSSRFSLRKSIEYLNKNIHEDGSFGADFWDTCRFGCVIIEQNLKEFFPYQAIHDYIVDFAKSDKLQKLSSEIGPSSDWSGPGTFAMCANFLFLSDDRDLGNEVLTEALKMKQSNGCFTGKKNKTGDNKIHPIWHTAQMLMALMKSSFANNEELINCIISWIEQAEGENGEYDDFGQVSIYYTSYAVLAMQSIPSQPSSHLEAAIRFLLSQNRKGKYGDCGGSVMVADALRRQLQPNDLSSIFSFIRMSDAKMIWEKNIDLQRQIDEFKEKITEYERKYSGADIVLSKKDVWIIGIWITVVVLLLGIIAPIIINIVSTKSNELQKEERPLLIEQKRTDTHESQREERPLLIEQKRTDIHESQRKESLPEEEQMLINR